MKLKKIDRFDLKVKAALLWTRDNTSHINQFVSSLFNHDIQMGQVIIIL